MSALEPVVRQETELGSSVKLVRNASGKTQIEVKVRTGDEDIEDAAAVAQRVYDALCSKYGAPA